VEQGQVRVGVHVYEAGADAHILSVDDRWRVFPDAADGLNGIALDGDIAAVPGIPCPVYDSAVTDYDIGHGGVPVPEFSPKVLGQGLIVKADCNTPTLTTFGQ